MARAARVLLAIALCLLILPGSVLAADQKAKPHFRPGSAGAGDPYFPLDGNGGYDVKHYDLDIRYDPADRPARRRRHDHGTRDAEPVPVRPRLRRPDGPLGQGRRASRDVAPRRPGAHRHAAPRHLPNGACVRRQVRYDGIPTADRRPALGANGLFHTDDGAVVVGEPHVASTWFPVNDHPSDKASYTFHITVPKGLEAVANGVLTSKTHRARLDDLELGREGADGVLPRHRRRSASSTSHAYHRRRDPLSGTRSTRTCSRRSRRPHTGTQFAISQKGDLVVQAADAHDQRPGRRRRPVLLGRPATPSSRGTSCSSRRTPRARDDWTTLPDLNGHTSQDTGLLVPVLARRSTRSSPTTRPTTATAPARRAGTTGAWWAATGARDGWEQWDVDLSACAGKNVEVSISYASDDVVQRNGPVRRRHRRLDRRRARPRSRTTATRSTAGRSPARPRGSAANPNDWIAGTVADTPDRTPARIVQRLVRPPAGDPRLRGAATSAAIRSRPAAASSTTSRASASRSRTRPGRSTPRSSSRDPINGDDVVVHELAHQWYGDNVALEALAGHLAQRGLRDLRRVAVERARGPRHGPGELRLPVRHLRRRRSVLDAADRRPGAGSAVRLRRSTPAAR